MVIVENLLNFNHLVKSLACIGFILNTFCVCLICSRKKLHQPINIFVSALLLNDILSSLDFIISAQWPYLRNHNLISCKTFSSITLIADNFEPILLVTSLIVFTVRPEINVKKSAVIILTIFCAAFILATPEILYTEISENSDGRKICNNNLSGNEILKLISFILTPILPVVVLMGMLFMPIFEKKQKREIMKISNDFEILILQMMLMSYIILMGPLLILIQNYDEIYEFFGYDDVLTNIISKAFVTISVFNLLYKPFLLYFMNDDIKTEISNTFRSSRSRLIKIELQNKISVEEIYMRQDHDETISQKYDMTE